MQCLGARVPRNCLSPYFFLRTTRTTYAKQSQRRSPERRLIDPTPNSHTPRHLVRNTYFENVLACTRIAALLRSLVRSPIDSVLQEPLSSRPCTHLQSIFCAMSKAKKGPKAPATKPTANKAHKNKKPTAAKPPTKKFSRSQRYKQNKGKAKQLQGPTPAGAKFSSTPISLIYQTDDCSRSPETLQPSPGKSASSKVQINAQKEPQPQQPFCRLAQVSAPVIDWNGDAASQVKTWLISDKVKQRRGLGRSISLCIYLTLAFGRPYSSHSRC